MQAEKNQTVSVGNRQYILGSTLGVGGFSEVKKGVDKVTRKRVALKIMYTEDQDAADRKSQLMQVQKEIKAMKQLNHPNIIRLLGYDLKCSVNGKRAIVMVQQLAPKGELFDYLMYTKKFKEPEAISLFRQLIAGLTAMHDANIAHRDLKPENLLFDNQFNLKLADFGFSYVYRKGEGPKTAMRTELGTKGYMSPEILTNKKYTEKADIFAAGVILFIMLAGFPPFQNATSSDWWFDKLQKKKYKLFWMAHERTAKFSDNAKDILQKMLADKEAERLDVHQVTQQPFYNSKHLDKAELQAELKSRKQRVDKEKQEEKNAAHNRDSTSRDTLLEVFNALPAEARGDLPNGKPLLLKNIMVNTFHQDLAKVGKKADFVRAIADLDEGLEMAKEFGKMERDDEDFVTLSKFLLDVNNLNEQTIAENDMVPDAMMAKFLQNELKNTMVGKVDDWAKVKQFAELDSLPLPNWDLEEQKNHCYHVKFGFGLLAYCLAKFADQKGKTYVDTQNRHIDIVMKVKKPMILPQEDPNNAEKVAWKKCCFTVKLKIRASLRSAMHLNPDWGYILTFQNISEDAMSMHEFDLTIKEITTNNAWFLSLLMDERWDPSKANYNDYNYDDEDVQEQAPEEEVTESQ